MISKTIVTRKNEIQESMLRQKAMLIIARYNWSSYAWKRVSNRLTKCIVNGEKQ